MTDYQIAIPSKGRSTMLLTLELLRHVPSERITIFVEPQDEASYRDSLERMYTMPGGRVAENIPKLAVLPLSDRGIAYARNRILKHYQAGTNLVMMDDDVQGFLVLTPEPDGKAITLEVDMVDELFRSCFAEAKKNGAKLWGLYPVPNAFFMSYTRKSAFCIGSCFGVVTSELHYDENFVLKEDYDFTLQHYKRDGKVYRFNNIAVKAKHYKNTGGCHEYRNDQKEFLACDMLKEKWGPLVRDNPRRKNEVLLKLK